MEGRYAVKFRPWQMGILAKLSLFALLIVALFAAIILGLIVPHVGMEKRSEREAALHAMVESAASLMWYYEECLRTYRWKQDPSLPKSRAEAQERVLAHLRQLRYGQDDYIFVLDGSARMVMHPLRPELAGADMSDTLAPDGSLPFREMAHQAQSRQVVFLHYTWLSKWSQSVNEPQTTCAQYFYPWNWVVCSSLYTQDIDDAMHRLVVRTSLYIVLGLLAGWLVLFALASLISKPIALLARQVRDITEHPDHGPTVNITVRGQDEIGKLAEAFRQTFSQLQQTLIRLTESEESLRTTLYSIGDAVIATDVHGVVVRMNPVAEKLTGWPIEDAVGKPLSEVFHIVNSDTSAVMSSPVDIVLEHGRVVELANNTMLNARDGREYHVADSAAPIRDAAGAITGVVLVFRDVTEKYALQAQLQHSRKMEAVGQLAGGVAHDFNNMLVGIIGGAQLLEKHLPDDPKVAQYHRTIMESAKSAAELTEKLLAFARRQPDVSTVLDVHKVLRDTVDLLQNTLDRRIDLKLDLAAKASCVVGNPSALQNAFLNLGINASHAMPQGGVLAISSRTVALDASFCRASSFDIAPGAFLEIEVRDTGCGIPRENLSRIFEPFFTTKEPGKGTGLGLAAVYGTVQQHKGAISVYSEVGVGSSFQILLPLNNAPADLADSAPQAIRGTGCILVVDDENSMRVTAKATLESLGYRVLLAEDGLQGIEVFTENIEAIDAVILDMIMPKMNGRDCFCTLRKLAPSVRVILASGFTREEDLAGMKAEGLCGFIQKPFLSAELGKILHDVLQGTAAPDAAGEKPGTVTREV